MTMKTCYHLIAVCALASHAHAAPFSAPVNGSKYIYNSSLSGEVTVEVLSTGPDTYSTKTQRQQGAPTEENRLFGLYAMTKQLNEGILSRDLAKARGFFPLQVGNKVSFDTYGQTNGPRWYRTHRWEAVKQYSMQVGSETHQMFVVKLSTEIPGHFKNESTCDYSTTYAACVKVTGDLFVASRPEVNGPYTSHMAKAIVRGATVSVSDIVEKSPASTAEANTPAPANPVAKPMPVATPTTQSNANDVQTTSVRPATDNVQAPPPQGNPTAQTLPGTHAPNPEHRLKQAKELLEKKLITQQNYDEFVNRIMKDM